MRIIGNMELNMVTPKKGYEALNICENGSVKKSFAC